MVSTCIPARGCHSRAIGLLHERYGYSEPLGQAAWRMSYIKSESKGAQGFGTSAAARVAHEHGHDTQGHRHVQSLGTARL